ncbi:MAG: leucyl aminopeptidase family protein [Phycisphaerae bacterium]|nr:leucyl aminopeptidase family protein [Phycisphaerae bacterium]
MFESIRVGGQGTPAALVLGYFKGEGLDKRSREADRSGMAASATQRGEATGEAGRIAEVFPPKGGPGRILVVGLGEKSKFKASDLRGIAAAVGRRLASTKDASVEVELSGPLAATRADHAAAGSAFGEGLGLLGWVCDTFKGKATTAPTRAKLLVRGGDSAFRDGLERGLALAASANWARTLSETPPNVATPDWMAEQATKMARKAGLGVRVFRGKDLERERFIGLINVGKASENKPCMIRLEYTPDRPRRKGRPVVLIGKTMTYDSGGLSLKVNNGMVGMKRDKDGGCGVLGAMHAIATVIKPRVPVVALLASAENSISDEAYRPDDVLRYRNGVTVEITNTDAEGRLVLADAFCYACEVEKPAYIVELSTLTGGVVTALGSTYAGLFCDDDALRAKLDKASAASGERVWRLPMHPEYREMMKSPIADILNSNPNRKAHPIQGAAFLSYFVEEGVPWAHIDIAGVHAVEGDSGPFVKGPTGWGARLLANLLDAE